MARCLKLVTLGKVDYIERAQQMVKGINFQHNAAKRDFGYRPMHFSEGLKIKIEEYLKTVK